jgi:chromosome segregation ATPase
LITGTVAAAAAAAGTLWMVRLGVAAAISAALLACAFAWRELNSARHAHADAMLKAAREHGAALTEERSRNAAVVDALGTRIFDASKVIERQRMRMAAQRLEISGLKEDRVYLRGEVEYRVKVISALRETVREQEVELITPPAELDAEVHHMPRRVLAGQEDFVWQELSAEDEITGAVPSLADLAIISMAQPEYEDDRQPA